MTKISLINLLVLASWRHHAPPQRNAMRPPLRLVPIVDPHWKLHTSAITPTSLMRCLVLALTALASVVSGHCQDRDGNQTATMGCLEQTNPKREQKREQQTDLWLTGSSSGEATATVSVGTGILCDQLIHTIERLDLNSVSTEDLHELIQTFESSCFPSEPASSHSAASATDAGGTNSTSSGSASRSRNSELANARSSKRTTTIVSVVMAEVAIIVAVLVAVVYSRRRKQLQREQKSLEEMENAHGNRPSADPTELTQLRLVGMPFDSARPLPMAQNVQMMPPFRASAAFSSANSGRTGLWEDPAILVVRIPRDKVLAEDLVEHGGYGEVYRGSYKGQCVAIKSLLPAIAKDIKQINAFLAEAKIMSCIEHERVVRFVGVAWDSLSDLCVVTEFMDGGDLRALLTRFEEQERRPRGFDAVKLKIALHVAQALTYLHSLQPVVVHRDLKSRNILLNSHLDAKVTDFGVSRRHSDCTMTAGVGTSFWMAPEVMMGERYDEKADIFSFGVVLTELDSHQLPYSSDKYTDSGRMRPDAAILQMVAIGILRARFSANVAKSIKALGRACLALDPRDRPTAAEAMFRLQAAAL